MRFAAVLLLAFVLTGCPPVPVTPIVPTPPPAPAPVVTESVFTGRWFGRVTNTEGTFITVLLVLVDDEGSITGAAVFLDEPVPALGQVTGNATAGAARLLIIVTDGTETIEFVLVGAIIDGMLTGVLEDLFGAPAEFSLGGLP